MRARSALAGTLLACACFAGCASSDVDVDALSRPGPYGVGYRIFDVSYRPPLATEDRTLSVHVWYPAQAVEGERPIYLLRTSTLAIKDAPPLELGPRPVLLYSHGHQAYAAVMSYLMEHLASHGYVAIAPTHTGNTFLDGDHRETDIYYLRALDIRATLDHFQALADDPLSGRLSDRIAMSGHSFGGYTTMAIGGARYRVDELDAECASGQASPGYCSTMTPDKKSLFRAGFFDDRFRALVDYDPGDFELFGAAGVAAIDRPVLHFVAEKSGHTPHHPEADEYWTALHGREDLRLLLLGGDHNDFTDSCASGFTVRCSNIPPEEAWKPVRVYTLAFLEKMLGGAGGLDPLLHGEQSISTRIETTAR